MKIFNPDYIFEKTIKITPEFLKEKGIENLLLDVDNTLTTHNNPHPADGIMDWLKTMQDNGIQLMIVSNNQEKRVQPFADLLGLPFMSFATKPLPRGFTKGMKALGGTPENTAIVGDQIFTDIMGGNLRGVTTIMSLPIEHEDGITFKIKRYFEKTYINDYIRKNGGVL